MLRFAVHRYVGHHDLLVGIEIPAIFRRFLKMPDVLAGVGLHRDN